MKETTKTRLSVNSTKILIEILSLINEKMLKEDVVKALFESMSRKIQETNQDEDVNETGFITLIEVLPGSRHRPGFPFLRKSSAIEVFAFVQIVTKANNFNGIIKSRTFDGNHFLVANIKKGKDTGNVTFKILDEKSLKNETLNLYILSEQIH